MGKLNKSLAEASGGENRRIPGFDPVSVDALACLDPRAVRM